MGEEVKFVDAEVVDAKSTGKDSSPEVLVLNFADSKIPVFKEARNKDYIKYGEDNLYPEYLTYLYNKSSKHNAIITGKAKYIFGGGIENGGDTIINRLGETINDISAKAILDIEIYGGFRWEIIWGFGGKIKEIYHTDYSTLRKDKENGYWFKESWQPNAYPKVQEEFIPAFDPSHPIGSQIFSYNEYRPGVRFYPLPGYIGSNNFIETDIEISKYYLSAIRNGMTPSKMIQFFTGDPGEEGKRAIERKFTQKFAGSENSGKVLLVFNGANAQNAVQVDDLSASDLDKHMIELNKTCQQEIFSGHLVTNPALFGIMQEGKLGDTSGLGIKMAYEIFQNTYANPKGKEFCKELDYVLSFTRTPFKTELKPTDPVGVQIDIKDAISFVPKNFVFQKLGVPEDMWNLPAGGGTGTGVVSEQASSTVVNDHIKNLTGRQMQGINRIVRQYDDGNGKLTRAAATAMLKTGYGLSDEDVIAFLGEEPVAPTPLSAAAFEDQQLEILDMFDACGENKTDFEIVKSKQVSFSAINEIEEDENIYIQEAFKVTTVTKTEAQIIDAIKADANITAEDIAAKVGQTTKYVESKIKSLTKRGYIEGEAGDLKTTKPPAPPKKSIDLPEVMIKYSYEGPEDSRNRPFCAKMMQLNRLYSRYDIELISQRLGYSVFDRRGGFWRHKDGEITPYCRHNWRSNIVVKKGGEEA